MRLLILLVMAAGLAVAAGPPQKEAPTTTTNPDEPKVRDDKLRQELLQRMQDDQDARKPVGALLTKYKGVDPEEIKKMDLPAVKRMNEIDHQNTERMKEIVKRQGWPGRSLVGTDGANAAWILVQHADHDRPFQKQCLSLLTDAVKKGEATGEQLAYLTDRVRVGEKKTQVYGTQLQLVDGKYQPVPIEDEANVDKRRKELGLSPLADYLTFSEQVLKQWAEGSPVALSTRPADLSKIARTISKEPSYKGQPRYCLLVFGPEAKTHIWVVLDGDVLYVDRNGNGDLTEPGERVELERVQKFDSPQEETTKIGVFPAVEIPGSDGQTKYTLRVSRNTLHKDFRPKSKWREQVQKNMLAVFPDGTVLSITVIIDGKDGKVGEQAVPVCGKMPADAPVLHFHGPLTLHLLDPRGTDWLDRGIRRGDSHLLRASLCRNGLGKHAVVLSDYTAVPKDVHPVAEIEFPNKNPDKGPIRLRVTLDHRC